MPRNVQVTLCNGPVCSRQNRYVCDRLKQIQQKHPDLVIESMGCQSRCEQGPNLLLNGRPMSRVTPITASVAVKKLVS